MKKTIEIETPMFFKAPDFHIEIYIEVFLNKMGLRIKEMWIERMDYVFAVYFPEQEEEINKMWLEHNGVKNED